MPDGHCQVVDVRGRVASPDLTVAAPVAGWVRRQWAERRSRSRWRIGCFISTVVSTDGELGQAVLMRRPRTVAALIASQRETTVASNGWGAMKKRVADAEARLRRYQAAIAAGVDPAALVEAINEAQAQRTAAQAELEGAPAPNELTDAEVYAMIDSLGDLGAALADAQPESLSRL